MLPVHVETLAPGLRLHVSPDPRLKTAPLVLRLAVPLDEEASARALVLRVLAHGTERSPSQRAIQLRLEDLYDAELEVDAARLGDLAVLEARMDVVPRRFVPGDVDPLREGIAFLGELLLRPALDAKGRLRDEVVRLERENLVHEIQGLRDERGEYAIERAHRLLGRGEPSRFYELGTEAQARRVTAASLTGTWRALLASAPLDMLVAGDVDPAEVRRLILESLRPLADRPASEIRTPRLVEGLAPRAGPPARESERVEAQQAHVCVGFRSGVRYLGEGYAALVLLNAILGGDSQSRLFLGVRERDGLAYDAGSFLDRPKGHLLAHFGVSGENAGRVEAATLAEVERLGREAPSERELEEARKAVVQRILDLEDEAPLRLGFSHARALAGRPDASVDGLLATVRAVTGADVSAAARSLALDAVFVLEPESGSPT